MSMFRKNPLRRVTDPSAFLKKPNVNFTDKQNYLKKLPLRQRYPRAFVFGASLICLCIIYSAPLYYFLRTPSPNQDPYVGMWPSEIRAGKTHKDRMIEKLKKQREEKERKLAESQIQKATSPN